MVKSAQVNKITNHHGAYEMEKKKMKLLRVPEAAERLAVKESTIRKMVFEKRLPVVRIGRLIAIPEEFIEKIIHEGYSQAARKPF